MRSDIEVLSRAGLPLEEFLAEAADSVRRAVPWVAACVSTNDPVTHLLSSDRKFGDLVGRNEHDGLWGQIEYREDEPTSMRNLAIDGRTAVSMHVETGGDVDRSVRMSRLMKPHYGYYDEARLMFSDGTTAWGGIALFRGPDDPAFSVEDTDFLATLAGSFAQGVRAGLLVQAATAAITRHSGPAVYIVGADDSVAQMSEGAHERLQELRSIGHAGDPIAMLTILAGFARRHARGDIAAPPRLRVRSRTGQWLLLHASPLSGADGAVVVTLEEARPPEIIDLVVAAFDLTVRERDVLRCVLQGLDTKAIGSALHLSPYTVQDHLKSIFDKADVRSRRELIARIFFDQFEPRLGGELTASGWFASA